MEEGGEGEQPEEFEDVPETLEEEVEEQAVVSLNDFEFLR